MLAPSALTIGGLILLVQCRLTIKLNQWVVCHSPYLIWKYRCHINVESIASIKALKYIYKYVYKGHDCTTMEFGSCVDEILQYLDAKYVSSCEAAWCLYFFEVQDHSPSVMCLQVHLPNQQGVILNPDRHANLQAALEDLSVRDTTLTAWFKANSLYSAIHDTLYQDIPFKMVWQTKTHEWTMRKRGFQIGRMYFAPPSSEECFYLCLLLTTVTGATSFDDLYSFNGVRHDSFREACIARGLLDNDNEWHQCLQEAISKNDKVIYAHIMPTPEAKWCTSLGSLLYGHICYLKSCLIIYDV